jgi:hypothetical protein
MTRRITAAVFDRNTAGHLMRKAGIMAIVVETRDHGGIAGRGTTTVAAGFSRFLFADALNRASKAARARVTVDALNPTGATFIRHMASSDAALVPNHSNNDCARIP